MDFQQGTEITPLLCVKQETIDKAGGLALSEK